MMMKLLEQLEKLIVYDKGTSMSTLTKSERDGLEDVFLSIHSNHDKLKNIKELSALIIYKSSEFSVSKLIKQAKYGLKETNLSHFIPLFTKKKKSLSK